MHDSEAIAADLGGPNSRGIDRSRQRPVWLTLIVVFLLMQVVVLGSFLVLFKRTPPPGSLDGSQQDAVRQVDETPVTQAADPRSTPADPSR